MKHTIPARSIILKIFIQDFKKLTLLLLGAEMSSLFFFIIPNRSEKERRGILLFMGIY